MIGPVGLTKSNGRMDGCWPADGDCIPRRSMGFPSFRPNKPQTGASSVSQPPVRAVGRTKRRRGKFGQTKAN